MDTVLLQQIRKRAETTSLHQIISPKSMHEPISSRKDYGNNYKKQSGNARKIIFFERNSAIFAKCENIEIETRIHDFAKKVENRAELQLVMVMTGKTFSAFQYVMIISGTKQMIIVV